MGLLSTLSYSVKKSRKLRKLQLKIAPPARTADDIPSRVLDEVVSGRSKTKEALEQFLDLCEADPDVRQVMAEYGLAREDLEQIYSILSANGLGQWVKGHYAALSTIAYFEPLLFYVVSSRRNVPVRDTSVSLLDYWEGKVKQGALYNALELSA